MSIDVMPGDGVCDGRAASRAVPASRAPRRRSTVLRRRSTVLLAAGAMLPLPLLAGCSDDGEESYASAVPQDTAVTARSQVRDGGTVRWAVDAMPATLNTFQSDADAASDRIAGAVLPTLFTLDVHGTPQRNDDYLDAADVVQREPKQVVRYEIDKDAVWSDGRKIGADDFKAQWKALSGKDRAFWTARNAGYDRIQNVEQGKDAREVKVTFAKPYTDWRSLFTPLYPKAVMGSAKAFNDGTRNDLKATAGPFALGSTSKDSVTLVRNPKWWGDKAKLDKLVFTAVPVDKRTDTLEARRLEVAEIGGPAVEKIKEATQRSGAPQLPKSDQAAARLAGGAQNAGTPRKGLSDAAQQSALRGYTVRKSLEPAYTQLALNGSSGPLADERVRRAVARSIDRAAIAKAVLKPLGLPAHPLGSHLMVAGQQGYKDSSAALGNKDVEAAQALLTDAGWRRSGGGLAGQKGSDQGGHGSGKGSEQGDTGEKSGGKAKDKGNTTGAQVLQKDGKPLSLRFVLPTGPGTDPLRTVGDRITEMLEKIGIKTEITKVGDDSYFKDHIASGDYDLALWSWPASAYPATDARPIYAKPQPAADGSLIVEQNYTRVGTDHIDQLFDQAVSELDGAASRALVRRADARIWAAAGSVPLYQRPQLVAVRSGLVNVGAFGFATPRYQDIGFKR